MRFRISVNKRKAIRAMEKTSAALDQSHKMLDIVARGFRDHVRKTINSRDNGSWQNPSKWTRAKKRTNRALSGQARNITYIFAGRAKVMVVYQGASRATGKPISITEHHYGKTLQANHSLVKIAIKNPAPLRLPSGTAQMWFRWNRDSVVPARKIWPDGAGEAKRIAEPLISRWVQRTTDRTWR